MFALETAEAAEANKPRSLCFCLCDSENTESATQLLRSRTSQSSRGTIIASAVYLSNKPSLLIRFGEGRDHCWRAGHRL